MTTVDQLVDRLLAARSEISECVRNRCSSDTLDTMSVTKYLSFDEFQNTEGRTHDDYLLHVSNAAQARRMGCENIIASAPGTDGRRVYATAADLVGLEEAQALPLRAIHVVTLDRWLAMANTQREALTHPVLVTSSRGDLVSRTAGRRLAWRSENAPLSAEIAEQGVARSTDFLRGTGLQWHEGHYCSRSCPSPEALQHMLDIYTRKDGVLMARPHSACGATVTPEDVNGALLEFFPPGTDYSDTARSLSEDVEYNMTAVMPTVASACHVFRPVTRLEMDKSLVDDWPAGRPPEALYDPALQMFTIRA
jgi:hypothetical protein